MTSPDLMRWLQERTALGILSTDVLSAIAFSMEAQVELANQPLVLEDTSPEKLYILKQGRLESYRTSETGPAQASSLLPGAVIHLQELLLDQPAPRTVITLTDCELWVIPAEEFKHLVTQYPEIAQTFTRQIAQELAQVSAQLAYEQERQVALRPFLVPKANRGIVGTSRYAVRLRHQIKQAAGDRQSVLIFGEPGLGKDNAAALIHFSFASKIATRVSSCSDGSSSC